MKQHLVSPDITIKKALRALIQAGEKCLVVADENYSLLGTLSDGDLRKAILKNVSLDASIEGFYQTKPIFFVQGGYKVEEVKKIFLEQKFNIIPVVNKENRVVDVLVWNKIFKDVEHAPILNQLDVPVVIMAGGKGTRMEPFTKVLPKSLLPIHEKTIIEHIIERFTELGCSEFHITVNHKGKILKAFFEELQPEYRLHFVAEQEPLGTAGSLKSLQDCFNKPVFVTNCDIIVKANYASIYEFHKAGGYAMTLVASAKEYIIPYGTCELNRDGHLSHINEKPKYDFLINTGLYVLNPEVLKMIPEKKFYHITHLIEEVINQGLKVGVFPVDDDAWIDVGQWAEYKKAIELL